MKRKTQLIFSGVLLLFLNACKKEILDNTPPAAFITASNNSLSKTDGIITVQTGILPPVTEQSFIANGSNSIAEFQIASTQRILIYQLFFSATYPAIQSISLTNIGSQPNASGTITFNGSGPVINANSGVGLFANVNYLPVDSSTSGKMAQLKLTHIVYRTDDEKYHDFYPDNAGQAKQMCLVYNVPQVTFQDPGTDTLPNGFKQIAVIKFQGDTSWTMVNLPLNIASPFSGVIKKSRLVIKSDGKTVAQSDTVQLAEGATTQTIVRFNNGGMKHTAGKTEILKVYAPVSGFYHVIVTTMAPASSFVWRDSLSILLNGAQNAKYFKSVTGQSNYH